MKKVTATVMYKKLDYHYVLYGLYVNSKNSVTPLFSIDNDKCVADTFNDMYGKILKILKK